MKPNLRRNYPARQRRGSALLICTLAAVVISFTVMALARTTQVSHLGRKANRDAAIARATASGLYHRVQATGATGVVRDRDAMIPGASAVSVLNPATGELDVQVMLSPDSTVPFVVK